MKDRNSISLSDQKLLILASKISPQAVISLKRSVSVSKAQLDSFRDSLQSIGKKKIVKTEYMSTENWDKQQKGIINMNKTPLKICRNGENQKRKLNFDKNKIIRQELKIRRNTIKIQCNNSRQNQEWKRRVATQMVAKTENNKKQTSSYKSYLAFPLKQKKHNRHNQNTSTNFHRRKMSVVDVYQNTTLGIDSQNFNQKAYKTHSFWKKRGPNWDRPASNTRSTTTKKLMTTEPIERKGNATLYSLTRYNAKTNKKQIDNLILKLQLNLECKKHERIKTCQ